MSTVIIEDVVYEYINNELIIDAQSVPLPYDSPYLEEYRKRAHTLFSIRLCQWRRAYAESWSKNDNDDNTYLDFGCGHSPILEKINHGEWMEDLGAWYGTDCNEEIATLSHMSDRWIEPDCVELSEFDVVCFFDVMEHLRNYKEILSQITVGNVIVITVPCWQDWNAIQDIVKWRHYKIGEHFLYGSVQGWSKEICANGFELINCTDYESSLGRLDSWTMAFRKVK